jgi:hypothetical protein
MKPEKKETGEKVEEYKRFTGEADRLIHKGKTEAALKKAIEARNWGLNLPGPRHSPLLFCLNELGRFDDAIEVANNYWDGVRAPNDEAVLANTLCAMLAALPVEASHGLKLLKNLHLGTVEEWRSRFADFRYTPVQSSLIFNAALIFFHAGKNETATRLLGEVLEHIVFLIHTKTDSGLELSDEEIMTFDGMVG